MRITIEASNATLTIENGRIADPAGASDVRFRALHALLRPGLINAHDHLHRNHYGRLGDPPYPNAYAWARDIQERHEREIAEGRRVPRRDALLIGAWKNLCAGVTAVVHHDRWEGDFDRDFPLRVIAIQSADSIGMGSNLAAIDPSRPYALHVAEGVDRDAAQEVRTLAGRGLLMPSLLLVHGVGTDADGVRRIVEANAALIWCPASNLFLFGRTPPPALLAAADVLLGSDSLLTANGDLLDELRVARSLGGLDDRRLEDAVGSTAARRLELDVPSLAPGAPADLLLLARPLLEARAADVLLVMVAGVPRVVDPNLVGAWPAPGGRLIEVGGANKWIFGDAPSSGGPPRE
jgi:cytosine/adenosine deaminase-related metal-dependent hydrolase